jgi:GNAT superfamily N-acetyltransferase
VTATLTIRTAGESDVSAIWRVHTNAIQATCAGHYPKEVITAWIERLKPGSYRSVVRRGGVVIAEADSKAVGFGQINLPSGEIEAVYVAPDAQCQGVGAALLAHLEHLASREGMSRITLKSTINAEPFYAARGWRAVGRDLRKITQEIGLNCIAMEKELRAADPQI